MNWEDVLGELDAVPVDAWRDLELARIAEGDPALSSSVRTLERVAGVRTLGELKRAFDVQDVFRPILPGTEQSVLCEALVATVRRLAQTPPPPPASPTEVPRGGAALDEWAAQRGVRDELEGRIRVTRGPHDRKGVVHSLRELVDLERFPNTGARDGGVREQWRATGLEILATAVQKHAPEVRARELFVARRALPVDPWLVGRVALLENARKGSARTSAVKKLAWQYPNPPVRFEPKPPALHIVLDHVDHVVSLDDGEVTSRNHLWHGLTDREELNGAVLACAIDALSDPESPVVKAILAWWATPAHEHVLADFRRTLERVRSRDEDVEEERVAFRLLGADASLPHVLLQRARKGGSFTVGRKATAIEALRTPNLTSLERETLELISALESTRYTMRGADGSRLRLRLFELLSEHPRVSIDDDAKTPVRVRRGRACLRVTPSDPGFRIELVVGDVVPSMSEDEIATSRLVVAHTGNVFSFAEVDDATIALLGALESHRETFTTEGLDAILGALAGCPELAVDLALPDEVRGEPVAADERLVIQLALASDGSLHMALRVRPLENGSVLLPGAPPRLAYGAAAGKRVFATRDLDAEESRAERFLAELPLAGSERHGAFDLRIDDLDRACDVVASLGEMGDEIAIEWAESARLRVARTLGTGSLKLRIERKRDWFGVEGEALVDGQSIGLAALLAAARDGRRFVRLENGDLVGIDRELRARLLGADDVLQTSKDGIIAPPPALAAIGALVDDEDAQLVAAKEWLELRARVRSAEASEPELPTGLLADLRPYQLEGYRWLMRLAACETGGCLADDMGLGKTLQSLAVLLARKDRGPALVVAPTSVCPNWIAEAERFAPELRCVAYRGPERREMLAALEEGAVLVTSYDLVLRDIEELATIRFATAIFDEAHALKNAAAKRVAAVARLQAEVRFALTGTPIENHTGELWSLFRVVVPGLFGSWDRFRERFALPIERDRDATRQVALATVVRPYLLRRTKAEVSPELPPRTEIVRFVDLSAAERELYEAERLRAIASTGAGAKREGSADGRFALFAALTRLRQLACSPRLRDPGSPVPSSKLSDVVKLLRELKDAEHRALVFSQFTGHLDLVEEALAIEGIRFLRLDGQTPAEQRSARVARFQRGEADVFLISLKAGGTGLNLTAADYVVHLDPWWNPAAEDQASDRAHRIGQDKPVTVVRVIARGTIEESVLSLHAEKRELASAVLSGGDTAARLSTSELFALMEKSAVSDAEDESESAR